MVKRLNGSSALADGVGSALRVAELTAQVAVLQGQLVAAQDMCASLGAAIDQLRQEATILAGLHCIREGGRWEMTEDLLSQLPPALEIDLQATPDGKRVYTIVPLAPPD